MAGERDPADGLSAIEAGARGSGPACEGMTDDSYSTTATGARAPVAIQRNGASEQGADGERLYETWFERLLGAMGLRSGDSLRESLESALASDETSSALFTPEERLLLKNILEVRELRISDVMVPRADIVSVADDVTLVELLKVFKEAGHSRMPVYRGTLDDPIGFVHIKDVMAKIAEQAQVDDGNGVSLDFGSVDLAKPLKDLGVIRKVLFVPPSMPALDLMVRMQAARVQMALVVDEYGGTDGLVTLEDLVETVVGDIEDEHDETDEPAFLPTGENVWIVDARLLIEDFEEMSGLTLAEGDYREDVDTMGGLVVSLIGRVPVRGELIETDELPGWEFEVLDADPRRLRRLRLTVRPVVREEVASGDARAGSTGK